MNKILFVIALGISLLSFGTAFAAGGGGGGSIPTCTANVWTCTDWSSCGVLGTQARTCTETFTCPSATNPKPEESQTCTPPPAEPSPAPTPESTSTSSGIISTPVLNLSCIQSTWKCDAWSASCDANGQEHRACHLVTDCPQSPTPSPATTEPCSHLQCGNLTTIKDRIQCRVNLAPGGVARELQIQYLPEECRAETDATEKKECIDRYKSYQPCWNLPAGPGRFACAENILKLPATSVSAQVSACDSSANPSDCKASLRAKVLYMIKFRFYDLEQRAEDLYYRGLDATTIADFDTLIETKKQEFDNAKTDAEMKAIILDVRAGWQDFIAKANLQIK